ncbi:hypothetical protein GCM10023339_21140 [Alloalcanivorax gelatiniphagus]
MQVDPVVALLAVADHPERPDAAAVERDVDEALAAGADHHRRGVDPEDVQRAGTPQLAQGPHAAEYIEGRRSGIGAYSEAVRVAVECTMLWSDA